jgi:uncharacterized membrane protein YcaP (DUF421 family)
MGKEEIKLGDIKRLLFGDAPPVFMLEVFLRTIFIFIALLLALKLLGKRMTGQLSLIEMAVMLTLGAIVSVPMQIPERGIIQGVLILLLAVAFQRGLNYWTFKKGKVEKAILGSAHILVKDGVLQLQQLRKSRLSREQVFATLRNKEINNLGEVKRLYLEACGMFTVYRYCGLCEGLPIFPRQDTEFFKNKKAEAGTTACGNCGLVNEDNNPGCTNCGHQGFIKTIKSFANEKK